MLYSGNVYSYQQGKSSSLREIDRDSTGIFNETAKGFSAGIDQLQGLIGGGGQALAGSLVGNDEWFSDGMQYYNEQMTEAMKNEAEIGSLEEIEGVGDMLNYSAYIIGNLGSSLLGAGGWGALGGALAKGGLKKVAAGAMSTVIKPSAQRLAKKQAAKAFAKTQAGQEALGKSAVRGQLAGAFAFGTAAGAGESFTKILDEGGEEAPMLALATGVASGALDQFTPMRALKRILPQKVFREASEEIAGNILKSRSMGRRIFVEGLKSGGAEGLVEGMQEVIQNASLEYIRGNNPNIESSWLERMTSDEKMSQYLNAAVAGIIGGTAIGGVSGIARDPVTLDRESPDEATTPPQDADPDVGATGREEGLPRGDAAAKIIAARIRAQGLPEQRTGERVTPDDARRNAQGASLPDQRTGGRATPEQARRVAQDQPAGDPIVSSPQDLPDARTTPEEAREKARNASLPEQRTGTRTTPQEAISAAQKAQGLVSQEEGRIKRQEESESRLPVITGAPILDVENGGTIDSENKKFNFRGEELTLTNIRRDENGELLFLSVRDSKGKSKVIKDLKVAKEVARQIEGGAESVGINLDDLPVPVQEAVVDQAVAEGMNVPEEVTASEAVAIAQSIDESLVDEINATASSSQTFKPNDKKFFTDSKYIGSVRRPDQTPLSKAIAEVNKGLGEGRTPINEARLRETLTLTNPDIVDGSPVLGAEAFYTDDAPKNEILNAVVDLIEMGMPKSVLKDFTGIGIHDTATHPSMKDSDGTYNQATGAITLKNGYVSRIAKDPKIAESIRFTIAHEIGHAYDINNNITDNSPEFSVEINSISDQGLSLQFGEGINELAKNFESKTELGREMAYPFSYVFSWLNANPKDADKVMNVVQKEAFAQAFAVLHSNPELLEKSAPTTYNYLVKLLRQPSKEIKSDAQNDVQTTDSIAEPSSVQGEVRPRTESGSVQVQDGGGDQQASGDGVSQEQASPVVAEPTQREDGDDTGRPVQLDDQAFQDSQAAEERRLDEEVNNLDPILFEDLDESQMLFAPVSTRFPTGAKSTEDPLKELLVNTYESFVNAGPLFNKNIAMVRPYSNLTKEEQIGSDEAVAERLISHMQDNLLYIYDSVPAKTREISKQWYEGANRIMQRVADRHGLTLAQASAVAANLSPQKDWYQNASLAERVIDIYHENKTDAFDDQMKATAEVIYFHKTVGKDSRISNRKMLDIIQGKSLQDLINEGVPVNILGMWIRTYDQTYNSPKYRLVSPDGKFLDYAVNEDGKTSSRLGWGSLGEIGKAVTAVMNTDMDILSKSLGGANKVRNFYNNIFDPSSDKGFVTIDTHAVAAALLRPLGGKAAEVATNFGTQKGSSSSKVTGHRGTYSLYEEAYRGAAQERGVLAREMQSITWEAVRGLFTASYKQQKQNVAFVQGVWNQYNEGKLSLDEARKKIDGHSGGIQRPDWERSNFTVPDEVSGTSYEKVVPDSGISGQDNGLQEATGTGTGVDVTRVPTDTEFLSSPPREEDSNISDLSARREKKGLEEFKGRMMDSISKSVAAKVELTKKIISEGAFEGFEVGKRYASKHSSQETFGFKSEITALSIVAVSKLDRGQGSKVMVDSTTKNFGIIPESAIFTGADGKEYTANLRTTVINPDGDKSESSAALWKVKQQFRDGNAEFMGGLRSVKEDGTLSSPPRAPENLTPEEANAAQNARIREEKGVIDSLTSWASRTFKRNLSPQGLLNDEVFESKIKRDGELGAVEIDIRMHIAAYDDAVKDAYPEVNDETKAKLTEAMQTPVDQLEGLDLPAEVKQAVGRMRRYLDKYSVEYAQVIFKQAEALRDAKQDEATIAKLNLFETLTSNVGVYLNRSFRAFDDPNWAKNVPDDVLDNAKAYLEAEGATNVERVINTILKEGTAFDGLGSFIANSKLGAKDLSILKKRKEIAPEILALLGEHTDPRVNFVKTATKLSRLVFNHKFLAEVETKGKGEFLFTEDTAPSDAYVQLAADGSSVMAPLNGYYVTPELKQGFDEANGLDSLSGVYQNIVALNSIVKYGKTVIAPTTIARNFMSAGFFTVANGHFDWSKTQKSMAVFKSYFNSKEGDATAYLRELKRLGVIYDTPIAGELIKAMEDSGIEALQNELVGSEMAKGAYSKAKTKMQQWASKAARFYQYGDDFWKIVGFQNEMDMLMEAKGLSFEEAAPLAAERIRNTYPTYSLIGRAMQQLRRFPLAGTFVSFPAEIVRTSFNMFKYLKQDMADPDMRASAHRRLAGMAMVSGGIYAIQAAAFAAWDVSEEEEEAIRLMSPEWSRNSNIVVTGRDEKGDLEYIDLTYLDPYAYWKRPINALLRDQPIDDALAQSAQEMLMPFFGKDISAGTVFNLMVNEKDSGGRIYNPADTATNITGDMGVFLWKSLAPSVFQNLSRTMKAVNGEVSKSGKKYEVGDEALAWVGFRTTTFDPKVSLHFKAYEFNQDKRDATSILTSTFRDPNEVSNGDLINAFERASDARKEGFERMMKLVSSAKKSGLTDTELMMVLRSNGVTKKDARSLVKGKYDDWQMSDSTLKNTIKKSDLLFGKAKGQEFEERWKLIQQLLINEN